MQYTIRELWEKGISKTTVYEALKTGLPFSSDYIKNKRIFTKEDLEVFKYFKEFWHKKAIEKYWAIEPLGEGGLNQTVWNVTKPHWYGSGTIVKPDSNSSSNEAIKALSEKLDTVEKQFHEKEREYKKNLEEKEKLIQVKDNQSQKYALAKVEAEKDKKEWISKYEKVNIEKEHWMSRFYSLKMYFIATLVFLTVTIGALILVAYWMIAIW